MNFPSDPNLREIVEAVDTWPPMRAKFEQLAEAERLFSAQSEPVHDADWVALQLDSTDQTDVVELVRHSRESDTRRDDLRIARNVLGVAQRNFRDRFTTWLGANEAALCREIQNRREHIVLDLRPIADALGSVDSVADLSGRPAAAEAFSAGVRLLADWDTWSAIHAKVVDVTSAEERWDGCSWLYYDGWTEFWLAHPWVVDIGGGPITMTPAEGRPSPWRNAEHQVDDVRRIKVISRHKMWTPTRRQLAEFVEDADRVEAHNRAIERNRLIQERDSNRPSSGREDNRAAVSNGW